MPRILRNVALCYVRKSWTKDEKDSISPERQKAHIQAVCDANGWTPEWYEDTEGRKSGMHEKNRPAWMALKARLKDADVVALVANDLARLHRKAWRIGDLLEFVEQHGIRLVLADPARHIDFSTPYGKIFAQLSSIFDDWYAQDISIRRKADISFRKSQGKTVGIPPFGTKRDKITGFLIPSDEGAWLLPNGTWIAGNVNELIEGATWRGYFDLAKLILEMYVSDGIGRTTIARRLQEDGWAWRSRDGKPVHIETDDIRRVTNNWPEYGGLVLGKKAKDRHPSDFDLKTIHLIPERAVFDVNLLMLVAHTMQERTVLKVDRGRPANSVYPLSDLVWCKTCDDLALLHKNPKLQSRLTGKASLRYRHRVGVKCGCERQSVPRNVLENDFIGLVKMLTVKPEIMDRMKSKAIQAGMSRNEQELIQQKHEGIARGYRRIEAAKNLYSDGEINRDEYLQRKVEAEREISQWEAMDIDTEHTLAELTMAVDAINKIVRLWEVSSDEDKRGLTTIIFERIVFDLDQQQIVDFRLKAWMEKYFMLRVNEHETNGGNDSGSVTINRRQSKTGSIPVGGKSVPIISDYLSCSRLGK
ncbi:MAG: recombinase family protein [Chloroflexi bacterium]|nr:recombinase family protein [Chloroflexota bacterium]